MQTKCFNKKIDQRAEKEKTKKENNVRRRNIIIYYDLKLIFEGISQLYSLMAVLTVSGKRI